LFFEQLRPDSGEFRFDLRDDGLKLGFVTQAIYHDAELFSDKKL